MGVRNPVHELLKRLEAKSLEAQFLAVVRDGLNCSPFEAEAVLGAVREVFGPYLESSTDTPSPGQLALVAVSAEEPAGKTLADCQKLTVTLTVHRGLEDDRLLKLEGPAAFRRARIPDLCQEALSQGALLTGEDLAYRIFFVTPRTITRDLAALRSSDPKLLLPMRSTVHDIGPVLTHRVRIVRLALQGKTTAEICRATRHSAEAVANYLSTFTRCVQLHRRGMKAKQIAFLLRRGPGLIQSYLDLLRECKADPAFAYHLDELANLGSESRKKKGTEKEGSVHG